MTKKTIFTLPKIYEREELNIKLVEMYDNIKITLNDCIINNPVEFGFMEAFGLTPNQRIELNYSFEKELNKLTNNKFIGWCNHIQFTLINNIDASLNSLKKINKINNFTSVEMVDFIYNIIVYQIDDFEHYHGLSQDLLKDIDV